tara:strand:+ start:50 stop:814 length:765 start_codon:yes stop_codon:yes gene_type:complete
MKTLNKQTSLFTEIELTSSQEDSLVSHTVKQEKEKENRMNAICGQKCLEQFKRFNRPGLWARTFSELLIGQEDWCSKRCKLTWRLKGTKFNRLYFQLQVSTRRTKDIEPGLLPTAQTQGLKVCNKKGKTKTIDATLLPTPTEDSKNNRTKKYNQGGTPLTAIFLPTPREAAARGNCMKNRGKGNLEDEIPKMLPTPNAMEGKKITGKENQDSLTKRARSLTGKTSQLNPQFVAEMMGFPTGWTELPFQNGATNR